jgi:FAD/FMN-containing dehydrogenase
LVLIFCLVVRNAFNTMGSVREPHALVEELLQQKDFIVLIPTSQDWTSTKAAYISDNPAQPLAIARPKDADQVGTCVKIAHKHGVKLAVRVGGHDGSGRSIVDGCLVVDLREIKHIKLNDDRETATIGGGVLTGDVVKYLEPHGLVTPFPFVHTVGYAGWAMMGGYGWLASNMGLGVDQIVGARVVTDKGDIIDAEAELLKGIRGAGGNFGVRKSCA